MRKFILTLCFITFSFLIANLTAYAQISSYGYLVGTFVTGSNELESIEDSGTYMHYKFKVRVASDPDLYECAINFKNVFRYSVPYRAIKMRAYNWSNYGPIFNASEGWHSITLTSNGGNPAQGALDYIRHPGILNDVAGHAWDYIIADSIDGNYFELPDIDALFNNVSKIIVFGEPYSNGKGVHLIHQNQADLDSGFANSNAPYQDGAVIFVYNDGTRKILMKSFDWQPASTNPNSPEYQGQSDFSYTTDPDGTGPLKAGQAAPFTEQNIFYDQYVSGYQNGAVYGPYTAEQFEIHANPGIQLDCMSYTDVDIYLGHDATVVRYQL